MVSIPSCTNGAANTSGGICQQPGKATVIALGALTVVGAGAALLLGKLPRNVALGVMGAGAATSIVAALAWPAPKSASTGGGGTPTPTFDLKALVESLDGEIDPVMAEQLTELKLGDIAGMRDWKGKEADLVKLIEGCPNLEDIDMEGFVDMFGNGTDHDNAHAVIQALVGSSVKAIRAFEYTDGEVFTAPDVPKAALANAEEEYLPLLTEFDSEWGDKTLSKAFALVKTMPELKSFYGNSIDRLDMDVKEFVTYLYKHLRASQVQLGDTVKAKLNELIGEALPNDLCPEYLLYLGSGEISADNFPQIDTAEKWVKLMALLPDTRIDLTYLDLSLLSQELYEAAVARGDKCELPDGRIPEDTEALTDGMISLLRAQDKYRLENHALEPKVVKQLVTVWAVLATKGGEVIVPEQVGALPRNIIEALRQSSTDALRLEGANDEQVEKLADVHPGRVVIEGRKSKLTAAGMKTLIEDMRPGRFNFEVEPWRSNSDEAQAWTADSATWDLLKQKYTVEIEYSAKGEGESSRYPEESKDQWWTTLEASLGDLNCAGKVKEDGEETWSLYFQRKS